MFACVFEVWAVMNTSQNSSCLPAIWGLVWIEFVVTPVLDLAPRVNLTWLNFKENCPVFLAFLPCLFNSIKYFSIYLLYTYLKISIFILKLLSRLHREARRVWRGWASVSDPGAVVQILAVSIQSARLLGAGYLLFLPVLVSLASMKWTNTMAHTARGCCEH